jgi:ABC-type dipeptide/oligopeptide/nickel transport system permease subunit
MAMTLIYAFAVAFLNLVVDVLYAYIDPRIRYSWEASAMATDTSAIHAGALSEKRSSAPGARRSEGCGGTDCGRRPIPVILAFTIAIFGPFRAVRTRHRTWGVLANGGRPVPPGVGGHLLGTDQLGATCSPLARRGQNQHDGGDRRPGRRLGIGVPVGAITGWFGGRCDTYLMRLTDVIYAFPDLLFIILLSVAFRETVFGQALNGLFLVFFAIGLTSWVTVARLVRGQLLSLKETEFVEAARAIGVPDRRIIIRHLIPNGLGPIIVAVTLGIPGAILSEATLAYIGVGVQPPRASWGSLVAEGQKYVRGDSHLALFPALAIALAL